MIEDLYSNFKPTKHGIFYSCTQYPGILTFTMLHPRVRLSQKQISKAGTGISGSTKLSPISRGVHSHYQLIPFLKVHLSNMFFFFLGKEEIIRLD